MEEMMSETKRKEHPLSEALIVAAQVEPELSLLCDRVLLVGSARRQRPWVHDIDFVVIPQGELIEKKGKLVPMPGHNRWFEITPVLKEILNAKEIKTGGEDIITLEVDGIQVDINRATEYTWAILSVVKTGSPDFNIELCKRAQALGMKLSPYAGIYKNGELLNLTSEEDVFKTLQLPFIQPDRRDGAVADLRAGRFTMTW